MFRTPPATFYCGTPAANGPTDLPVLGRRLPRSPEDRVRTS